MRAVLGLCLALVACSGVPAVLEMPDAAAPVPDPVALEVLVEWSGAGSVSSGDGAWSCSDHCTATWDAGSTLVLKPSATLSGATFAGWGGDCTGTQACEVTLDQPRRVIARFVGGGAWPRTVVSESGGVRVWDIADAPDGGLLLVGNVSGPGQLWETPIDVGEHRLIAKLSHDGTPVWSALFAPVRGQFSMLRVASAADGTIYVLGQLAGNINGGEVTLGGSALVTTAFASDVIVAAFDADGTHRWSKRLGTGGVAADLVIDRDGHAVVLAGYRNGQYFSGAYVEDGDPAHGSPQLDAIVLDHLGSVVWARPVWGSYEDVFPVRGAVRTNGTLAVAMTAIRYVQCLPGDVCGIGQTQKPLWAPALAEINSSGDAVRAHVWTIPSLTLRLLDVSANPDGSIALLGVASGTHFVVGMPISSQEVQAFVATVAPPPGDATSVITRPWPTLQDGRVASLPDGSLAILGLFNGPISVVEPPYEATSDNPYDQFIARVDATGQTTWSEHVASLDYNEGLGALAVDRLGHLFYSGGFAQSVQFGTTTIDETPSSEAAFVQRVVASP